MLDYLLIENLLTAAPDDMRAQVTNVDSYTQNDLIDRIMKIGAGLTRSDVASILEAEKQVMCDIVADGGAFTTELFNVYPSMPGVYESAADSYDPSRHKIKLNLQPGVALRAAVTHIQPRKVSAGVTGPQITSVLDTKSGSMNAQLTPNRTLRISGQKLKIAGDHPDVGVYFISANNNQYKVDPTDFITNHPLELVVTIPALSAGTYRVQVVTQYSGGSLLKAPASVTFEKVLTVA